MHFANMQFTFQVMLQWNSIIQILQLVTPSSSCSDSSFWRTTLLTYSQSWAMDIHPLIFPHIRKWNEIHEIEHIISVRGSVLWLVIVGGEISRADVPPAVRLRCRWVTNSLEMKRQGRILNYHCSQKKTLNLRRHIPFTKRHPFWTRSSMEKEKTKHENVK